VGEGKVLPRGAAERNGKALQDRTGC
jgi:hypothetical protein